MLHPAIIAALIATTPESAHTRAFRPGSTSESELTLLNLTPSSDIVRVAFLLAYVVAPFRHGIRSMISHAQVAKYDGAIPVG